MSKREETTALEEAISLLLIYPASPTMFIKPCQLFRFITLSRASLIFFAVLFFCFCDFEAENLKLFVVNS